MSFTAPPREIGVGFIAHPDPLRVEGYELELIVDPLVRPLYDGDPLLGWAGDPRLALYMNRKWLRWELWRLEADGVYRMTTWHSLSEVRAPEIVPRCIMACVASDQRSRRKIHLHDDVLATNEKAHRPVRDKAADMVAEALDRVQWGIRKDTK